MIGFLKGIVEEKVSPYIFIDVSGVGYKVLASQGIFSSATTGKPLKVYTYTHVREDALELYGFLTLSDLGLFEQLISVSGIGPKTAIGIFTIGSSNDIAQAIIRGDTTFFTAVPRLGKKNAQKIIIELKNKLGGVGDMDLASSDSDDVVSALKSFGFSAKEVYEALKQVDPTLETETKIKLALKYLGK